MRPSTVESEWESIDLKLPPQDRRVSVATTTKTVGKLQEPNCQNVSNYGLYFKLGKGTMLVKDRVNQKKEQQIE